MCKGPEAEAVSLSLSLSLWLFFLGGGLCSQCAEVPGPGMKPCNQGHSSDTAGSLTHCATTELEEQPLC